jgi:N-acetylglucosaminyldiphosphoundecaprenol N-acetyl-beta-D-mannosaminyltransferase
LDIEITLPAPALEALQTRVPAREGREQLSTAHACVEPDGSTEALRVNGVRLDPLPLELLLDRIASFVDCGRSHVVHFLPADPTVIARRDPAYREVLNRGDLNLVDGASVALAARLFGHEAPRLTGSDALSYLASEGVSAGFRHYLYGGAPAVVSRLGETLTRQCPGIEIVGVESPPFRALDDEELRETAEQIRATGADLLWIGLGTPKQDVVAERLRELGAAPVILCVGAAFDFVAGTKRRAPRLMRSLGLEWLFRLGSEPARLWRRYLIGNAQFVAGVLRDYVLSGA